MKKFAKWICSVTGIPIYFFRNLFSEAKMMFVRLYGFSPMFRRRLAKAVKSGEISAVFGCGETHYPGWLHIDCFFGENVDLVMDLRRRLPFKDQSIKCCYSEHFLEHLYPVEAKSHLSDVLRVLEQGGVYRIVVPDTGKFMRKYAEDDATFFANAHPWERFPIDAIYSIVNWGGEHRSIYDAESLERIGRAAGFTRFSLSSVNGSSIEAMTIDRNDEHRIEESLYFEMVK
jgi:predicted SAM-dependent methyltransferase